MTKTAARSFNSYPLHSTTDVRHSDTDRLGHVNNVAYTAYFEFGRAELLLNILRASKLLGHAFVIVRLEIDYRTEMHWPGKVDLGVGIEDIGRSSVTFAQGLFNNGVLIAEAKAVVVLMNETSRKSAPLTPALITELNRIKLR